MKKIIVRLFALFLIAHCTLNIENCSAQWVQMSNGMGNNITVKAFTTLGNNIFAGTNNYGVYLSTNYGINWTQISFNNQNVWALAMSGNTIFAAVCEYTDRSQFGNIYLSTNNGINWTQTLSLNKPVNCFATYGDTILAGTMTKGVYFSINRGVNWTQSNYIGGDVRTFVILGNTIFLGGISSGVYKTSNNGIDWTPTSLVGGDVYAVEKIGNNIFAGYQIQHPGLIENYIVISSNYGLNWSIVSSPHYNYQPMVFASYMNSIFAGSVLADVYFSTNNGSSWINWNQGFNGFPYIWAFLITNGYIFAGTSGGVYRRNLTDILNTNQISPIVPEKYLLQQNYPNPFNPTTKIKFDIPKSENGKWEMENGLVTLKVYNILGAEIETLVNEKLSPGTYEVTFNASSYPSGVYFYRLTTDNFTDTKKMILLK